MHVTYRSQDLEVDGGPRTSAQLKRGSKMVTSTHSKGHKKYLKCTNEMKSQLANLFEVGLNMKEIANILKISESDIEKLGYVATA